MKKAFTLIELLVVVLIIGILAAVALPQYQKAVVKSRYATIKGLVHSIAQAQEVYYLANGQYALSFDDLDIEMPGGKLSSSTDGNYDYDWGWCNIAVNGGAPICLHTLAEMAYQEYLEHSGGNRLKKLCIAYNTTDENNIRSQICKADTGKSNYNSKSGPTNAKVWINWLY